LSSYIVRTLYHSCPDSKKRGAFIESYKLYVDAAMSMLFAETTYIQYYMAA